MTADGHSGDPLPLPESTGLPLQVQRACTADPQRPPGGWLRGAQVPKLLQRSELTLGMTAEGPGLPRWQSRPRTEGCLLLVGTSRGQGAQGPVLPLGGGTSFGTVAVRLETSPSVLPHLTPLTPLVRAVWGWRTLTSESVCKDRSHGSEEGSSGPRDSLQSVSNPVT